MLILITRVSGITFLMKVQPSDTIFSVKVKIAVLLKIPATITNDLELFFADERLENSRTVEHYNILPGTKLQLRSPAMEYFLRTGGGWSESRIGIRLPTRLIRLVCCGKHLWNDHLTLEQYKIETHTTFHLTCRLFSCRENCPGTHAHWNLCMHRNYACMLYFATSF